MSISESALRAYAAVQPPAHVTEALLRVKTVMAHVPPGIPVKLRQETISMPGKNGEYYKYFTSSPATAPIQFKRYEDMHAIIPEHSPKPLYLFDFQGIKKGGIALEEINDPITIVDLARLRANGMLPANVAYCIADEIRSAFARLHEKGFYHCDVTCSNMLFVKTENGYRFVLIDPRPEHVEYQAERENELVEKFIVNLMNGVTVTACY